MFSSNFVILSTNPPDLVGPSFPHNKAGWSALKDSNQLSQYFSTTIRCFVGIGFTMSILIATLAFHEPSDL
jgi:Na+/H+ antiporter NhaA